MPKYKCSFQDFWLNDNKYLPWLQKDKDNSLARCKVCAKTFSVSSMGVKALDAHAAGAKHIERLPKKVSIVSLTQNKGVPEQQTGSAPSTKQCNISDMLEKDAVFKAELIWCLDVVQSKYSFRSSDSKSNQFACMFSDSKIAKDFSCGRTKCGYLITHSIAPHFKKILVGNTNELEHFVCLFDESYNKIVKKGQMDLHVRFWNKETNTVCTRYYTSGFMGKAAAPDILKMFKFCMTGLSDERMLQVSMDGPNVNKLFLSMLNEERKNNELSMLIDIGTCGLHTINNSLQTGAKATDWNLKKLMSSMFHIFHESPSRSSDYERMAEATRSDFAYMFCATRWAENQSVARKAREVWSKVVIVVEYWKSLPKRKQPGGGKPGQNTSFEHLSARTKEVLVPLKLKFFEEISGDLNAFLGKFLVACTWYSLL